MARPLSIPTTIVGSRKSKAAAPEIAQSVRTTQKTTASGLSKNNFENISGISLQNHKISSKFALIFAPVLQNYLDFGLGRRRQQMAVCFESYPVRRFEKTKLLKKNQEILIS